MNEQVELDGTLEKIIFRSAESGFSVALIKVSARESVTVRGSFSHIQAGERVVFKGVWVNHAKFGRQFEASSYESALPATVSGIQKYLASGLIKGIGPGFAKRLVDRFGLKTLEVIDATPERLTEVDGIGEKRIELIIKAWKDQKEISRVMVFLQDKDISPDFAAKIFKAYGNESITKITQNPYRLSEDIWGVGFKSADKVALKLGFAPDSPLRVKASILYVIAQETSNGHLYALLEQLRTEVTKMLELASEQAPALLKEALSTLYAEEKIKLITYEEKHFITLPQYYFSEKGIAAKLLSFQKKSTFAARFNFDKVYASLSIDDGKGIVLNEEQQRGILLCLQHKVAIITGGPGTGKTTLIKKFLEVLKGHHLKFRLAAPTGRAAKRMFEGTGHGAETLHRILEFSPQTMAFTKNEQNAIDCDFLIVDEASMIDVFLMHSLLKALPDRAHLILIGDVDQLPSVGAGNILNDLICSGIIPVIALKHIFRQAQDSLIIVNAHRVNKGEFPTSSLPDSKNDFMFLKEDNAEKMLGLLAELYQKVKQRGIAPADTIVLCPMNRGIVGTVQLNAQLQNLLNPAPSEGTKQIMRFGQVYRIHDRVMQVRNNYDKFVFNGDIGFVEDVEVTDQVVHVRFGERVLPYEFAELNELTLSYAISIHKSQGSEFRAVIVPLFMQHFMMLQRNLIYTALTRAKQFCIFVGQSRAIAMGIKKKQGLERRTFLKQFLTTDLAAR